MTQEEKQVQDYYRNTFLTPSGRRTFAHMLTELGYWNTVSTEEEIALQNYAKILLNHMGILTADNVPLMTEALLSVPVWDEPQEEGDE